MPKEKKLAAYLMVYFKDQTQSAYMAVSQDGYVFTDLNNGEPIFDGTKLAEQKGVKDPHIARGPDGAFYLAMTDLHIFGQRAGHRDTQWEAAGTIWLGKQPSYRTYEIIRPDTLDTFDFQG